MPCWLHIWCLREACDLKRLSHNGHLYGSSPVCLLMCVLRWCFNENGRWQISQINWRWEQACDEPWKFFFSSQATARDERFKCGLWILKPDWFFDMWPKLWLLCWSKFIWYPSPKRHKSSSLAVPWDDIRDSVFNWRISEQTDDFPWGLGAATCWAVSLKCFKAPPGKTPKWDTQ